MQGSDSLQYCRECFKGFATGGSDYQQVRYRGAVLIGIGRQIIAESAA
ncbi:hypothetical protein LBMAG46_05230 [Planctomycetia bacterium]|nr:hypothetical protein LBMAG46_05230 [Planctomycetia bacterium]